MRLFCIALLVPFVALAGCSSGSSTVITAALQEAADCTGGGFENVAGLSNSLFAVLEAIDTGNPPAGVTYDPNTGDFSAPVDLDGDGNSDGTLSGNASSVSNIADGIDVNETVITAWTLAAGLLSGSGTFNFERTAQNAFRLTGNGGIDTNLGCSFDVTAANVLFDFDAVNGAVSGTIDFLTNALTGDMDGTITFTPGSDMADVSASFLGVNVGFDIDLNTFTVVF